MRYNASLIKSIAAEAINFQNDKIGAKIEAIVAKIREDITDEVYERDVYAKQPVIVELTNLIKSRFGMKCDIILHEYVLAAVIPFFQNKNSIFLREFLRGQIDDKKQNKEIANLATKTGYVDNDKVVVSGAFSEATVKLYFDFEALIKDLKCTDAEITASILHELGHAFYSFEYSDRLDTTNQVIATILQDIQKDKARGKSAYIYKELKSLSDKVTAEDVDDILSDKKIVPGLKLMKVYYDCVKTQLSDKTYDKTSFEMLADNFASRFGYQEALVTVLEKIHQGSPEKSKGFSYFQGFMTFLYTIIGVVALITAIMFAGTIGFEVFATLVMAGSLRTIMAIYEGEHLRDYTYDELKLRYKRIRNQAVEELKQKKLNKTDLKDLLDQIELLDKTIMNTNIPFSLERIIMNFISPSARKAKNSIEEQQLLEEFVSNDLFLRSAELKLQA